MRFLLALSYRIFRTPFPGWVLLAMTVMSVLTAVVKALCWAVLPAALRPDVLRSAFQLAPFGFIPIAVLLALGEFRWKDTYAERRPVARWPLTRCLLLFTIWVLALLGLFGFNVLAHPAHPPAPSPREGVHAAP
ncbi:hypothetical protein [Flaviaesturariibacter amylovorans]|uniref:Uncharacterized protein n=1 Tax=Flaviaesturariibacter amylovorans TaxID=1084520 RepID=A0ABP8HU92_9BACT